jgi:hypothetical protein
MEHTILLMHIQGLREKLANNTFTQTKKSITKETANVIDRVLEPIGCLKENHSPSQKVEGFKCDTHFHHNYKCITITGRLLYISWSRKWHNLPPKTLMLPSPAQYNILKICVAFINSLDVINCQNNQIYQ